MRNVPGFLPYLQAQLHSLGSELLGRINDAEGLSLSNLISHVIDPRDHTVYDPYEVDDDIVKLHSKIPLSTAQIGSQALSSGEVAYCILAGEVDMQSGDPKALHKIPEVDISLLAIKTLQSQDAKHVWVMTNPSNYDEIKAHLGELSRGGEVKLIQQFESVRLSPDNQLYFEDENPSLYPCGSGDVISSLEKSGTLKNFLESGGKHVFLVDVKNVLAGLDLELIGQHIISDSPVTCEIVKRSSQDVGGILCNHMGVDQIVEQFRFSLPPEFDRFKWLNTNTYVFRADLDFSTIQWNWNRVKREFRGRLVIQHERSIEDLTATFQTQYVAVDREDRFMPIKTRVDLEPAARIFRKI